jgi:phage baseplate assembly protein W
MSLEIAQPFTLDNNGSISNVSDPGIQVNQHVNSLLSTIEGERVMLPTYGLNLAGLVFNNDNAALIAVMQQDVTRQFAKWEPSIQITSATPSSSTDMQTGVAAVNVSYIQGSNQVGSAGKVQNQSIVITVGGTVVGSN